jgi:hypothetical protein
MEQTACGPKTIEVQMAKQKYRYVLYSVQLLDEIPQENGLHLLEDSGGPGLFPGLEVSHNQ